MNYFKTDVHTETTYEITYTTDDRGNYELVQEFIRSIIDQTENFVPAERYETSLSAQLNALKVAKILQDGIINALNCDCSWKMRVILDEALTEADKQMRDFVGEPNEI